MCDIELPANNWEPRHDQMVLWEYLQQDSPGLRAVECAHRRWGKDEICLHTGSTKAFQRVGNYWHLLPQYNQCRKAIWEAVNPRTGKRRVDEAFPDAIRKSIRNTDMYIEFANGSSWQLVGSDNFNALVGSPPIGITFSEYALSDPRCWAYLSPILEENGGWAAFISTSRGDNHFHALLRMAMSTPGWFGEILTARQTPVFTAEKLQQIRAELIATFGDDMGEAMFQQEYMCSFQGAVLGAYFAKQMVRAENEGRITNVPHQEGIEVDTFWDLGVDDSMTVWFVQHIGQWHHVIDYYENSGYGLEHYANVLNEKDEKEGYEYGNHYMPHDANAREMTNSAIAQSRKEIAQDLGINPIIVVKRAKNIDVIIQYQIPAARNVLPLCRFDKEKCVQGISALKNYRAEYDEEKKKLSNRPLHDWSSHGSSAFITFAVGYGGVIYKDELDD